MSADLAAVEAAYWTHVGGENRAPFLVAHIPALLSEIRMLREARARDASQIEHQAQSLSAVRRSS